ncbi:MAG: polysaccharide biosynthesis tyrosine autokinase [Acidimicrobiales bacterium]
MALPGSFPEAEIRDYGAVLWRQKRWVIVVTTLGFLVGLGVSLPQDRLYQSTAEILLKPDESARLFSVAGADDVSDGTVTASLAMLRSESIRSAVTKRAGPHRAVSAGSDASSQVLKVSATSPSGRRSAALANIYAETFLADRRQRAVDRFKTAIERIQVEIDRLRAEPGSLATERASLEQKVTELAIRSSLQDGGAEILSPAIPASRPIQPRPLRNSLVGLAVGLVLGVGIVMIRDGFDDTIVTSDDLRKSSGTLPVLGVVPLLDRGRRRRAQVHSLVFVNAPSSPAAEGFRRLRNSLMTLAVDGSPTLLQITSPSSGEGKTTTAVNLAVALASVGRRVVVVCCDLRRPRLDRVFGLPNETGFTSVVSGDLTLSECLQEVPRIPNLWVMTSGPLPPNPSELLASERTGDVLHELLGRFEFVFVDSPPVLAVSDAAAVSRLVHGTVVVAAARSTRRGELVEALTLLHQVDARLAGVVLNRVSPADSYGYPVAYTYTATGEVAREPFVPTAVWPPQAPAEDAVQPLTSPEPDVPTPPTSAEEGDVRIPIGTPASPIDDDLSSSGVALVQPIPTHENGTAAAKPTWRMWARGRPPRRGSR